MKRCPITYEVIDSQECYSKKGLFWLSPRLQKLHALPWTAEEQRQEALARVSKIFIQGVQIKLSARLNVKEGHFELVEKKGLFILKPQSRDFSELPENEAITMTMARLIGLEVPVHGLLYSKDESMTYFIKRFDREVKGKKLAVEDFAQLLGKDRDTKYSSSMEQVITVIARFCTFPKIEFIKLLKLTLFNFLIGNEDMHLKKFSLITKGQKIQLAPAYDLLNSTIAMKSVKEETALPLNGKKNNLTRHDFLEYWALERLALNEKIIAEVLEQIRKAIPLWKRLITYSFLSETLQKRYLYLLEERARRLGL